MRVILDTNVVVSGVIWGGAPRQLLDAARHGTILPYTSTALLDELGDVLSREKFAALLSTRSLTPEGILWGYANLARVIVAPPIPRTVPTDADDDAVIACAIAANAEIIGTGDTDLLVLHPYRGISILKPADILRKLAG